MLARNTMALGGLSWPGGLARAHIVVEGTGGELGKQRINVMYNPTDLSLGQRAVVDGWGKNVMFHRTEPEDLVVSLFFDTFEDKTDVRVWTNKILALTEPRPSSRKGPKVPPTVRFAWADNLFTGIVIHVAQKFTMFLATGMPVRAELTVTFKEVLTDAQELAARGLDNCRKLWTVAATDRLDSIAYAALGDAAQWRLIADANGIYDPAGFPGPQWTGAIIAIPDTHGETFEPPGASDYV
ncbi:peptidoglycan-binding protein LysM [Trinickia caryophylli]|uniref:Contractile injection system tube protein N-terminal domain-containing protein n=1 Tax=Trinickia caryophylli TaxID=28094 RepID=A0A1X7GA87_TRICW|nr:peptidoglycan-binding protein LysM [Trinickia caryophylli]WQE11702.1 peptidoglycan-binding protein LysM [Trinickia caryophylli]GLU34887.1 peptidoglycan-binding protein [Trinickia caryophylli]SMF66630.1 hypothetical protein SAMN06295900_114135 [Trinickia caryophylli]